MNEISTLMQISQINRTAYRSRQIQAQKTSDRTQEFSAQVLGYDPTTGQYRVKNTNGKIFFSRAISNSSALCKRANISLVSPIGGTPIIDGMPG
ncbi:hypothetical protein ACE1AT_11165 [Pelatocladus sp. BLCC-F211]|uniref:hypothetical protein n=1 Tax=Pelatocladus sp. BLCC-F211 TaxID=3342752 RepID=UPI0035BB5C81